MQPHYFDKPKTKVLFVCLGNICRSPLAEAIFKHKIKEKELESYVEAESCGTANYHVGDAPDPRTISNAFKNGVMIQHHGRQLKSYDLEYFDFIFAMDESNYQNIIRLDNTGEHGHKISLMREFDPAGTGDVPDPYHGTERNFQEVFEILNRTIDNFIRHFQENILSGTKA
jgi:protein-tyrosine phosphatase